MCLEGPYLAVKVYEDKNGEEKILEQCQECGMYEKKDFQKVVKRVTE